MSVRTEPLFCDPSKLTISGHRVGSASIQPLACNPRAAELSHMIGALTRDVYFSDWLRTTAHVNPEELHNYAFDLVVQSDRAEFTLDGQSYTLAGGLEAQTSETAAHLNSRVMRALVSGGGDAQSRKKAGLQIGHFIPIILKAEEIFGPPVTSVGFQAEQEPAQIPVAPDHSSDLAAMRELFAQMSADHRASLDTIARGHEVSTQALVRSQSDALQTQSADHQHVIDHLMRLIRDFQQREKESRADVVGELATARRDLARLKDELSGLQATHRETEAENGDLHRCLSDTAGALAQSEAALGEKKAECADLHRERKALKGELGTLQAGRRALEGSLERARADYSQSAGAVNRLEAELEASVSRREELEDAVVDLTGRLAEAEGALAETSARADGLASDNEALSSELLPLRARRHALEGALTAAEAVSESRGRALEESRGLLAEAAEAKSHLEAQLAESDLALQQALASQEALGAELAQAQALTQELQGNLQEQAGAFAAQLAGLQATVLDQSKALESLGAEKEESTNSIRDLSEELDSAKERIRELETQLADKTRYYEEADATVTAQAALILGQQEEIAGLRGELTQEQGRAAGLEKDLAKVELKYNTLEGDFDALCVTLEEQKALIAELRKPGIDYEAMLEKAMAQLARRHDAEIKELTSQLEAKADEIEDLKADHQVALEKISKELGKTQEQLAAARSESDAFGDAYEASETARQTAIRKAVRGATAELEQRVEELLEERETLEADFKGKVDLAHEFTQRLLTEKDQTIQRYEEQVATLEADKAALSEQLEAALQLAEEKSADHSVLKGKYADLVETSSIVTEGLSDYESQIAKLQAQLDEASKREAALEIQLRENEAFIGEHETYGEEMHAANEALQAQVLQLQIELSETQEHLEAELAALKEELSGNQALIKSQEDRIAADGAYIETLEERPPETASLPEGYDAEVMVSYMAERDKLIQEHLEAIDANTELYREIEAKSKQIKDLTRERTETQARHEAALKESQLARDSLFEQMSEASKQAIINKGQADILQGRLDSAEKMGEINRQLLATTKEGLETERAHYAQVKGRHEKAVQDLQEMQGHLHTLSKQLTEKQVTERQAQDRADAVETKLIAAQEEAQEQQGVIASLREDLEIAQTSAARAEMERKADHAAYATLRATHEETKSELSDLTKRYDERVQELERAESDVQLLTEKEAGQRQLLTQLTTQHELLAEENERLADVDMALKKTKHKLEASAKEAEESARIRGEEDQEVTCQMASLRKKIDSQNLELTTLLEEKEAAISAQRAAETKLAASQGDIDQYDQTLKRTQELEKLVGALIQANLEGGGAKAATTTLIEQTVLLRDIAERVLSPTPLV